MVGQNKLIEQFNKFTINTLPHSIMLVGKYGCGKHLLCNMITEKFGLQIKQFNDKINYELLEETNAEINPTLCIINGNNITLKEEAVLLKFIEEPFSNIFIIIICETTSNIIETIVNRCQIYRFEDYTQEALKQFSKFELDPVLLKIADTPGKIIAWENKPFADINKLCLDIFNRINRASLGNILTIPEKLDFNETNNQKFNLKLFLDTLIYTAKENCIHEQISELKSYRYEQYKLTDKLLNDLYIPNINKQQLIEHYLFELKELSIPWLKQLM